MTPETHRQGNAKSPEAADGIGRNVAKGAAWMVLLKITERGLGLISTIVLARLLAPADFGLIAMAMSVYGVLEIMSSFSFDLALIQNQRAENRHYDTAWTFSVLFGVASASALVLLAVPVADFFHEPRLNWIMVSLALAALVQGFENIGIVAFQKDLKLHKEFAFKLIKRSISLLTTIPLAFAFRNYWALVVGIVVARIVGVALSYRLHHYRPRLSMAGRHDLFHFSKWMLINNLLVFANNRGVDFVIGKVIGPHALGYYTVAYEISNLPTTELVYPISRAVFPGYARMVGDPLRLREFFLQVTALIALITIPVAIGIALVAKPLVYVLLGEKWRDIVPLIQVLAVFGMARAMHGTSGSIYLALGVPRIIAYITLLHISIALPLLLWFMRTSGVYGAPWAILLAACVSMPVNYVVVARRLHLSAHELLGLVWRPVISTGCMAAAVSMASDSLDSIGLSAAGAQLIGCVLVGAIVYPLSLVAFWRIAGYPEGAEKVLFNRLMPSPR
jgi:O-antigen/teichoic acid export membrane protein